ncbi:hypothetical protein ACFXGM_07160 [Streptomyces albidoflavus]
MPYVVDTTQEQDRASLAVARRVDLVEIKVFELNAKVLDAEAATNLKPVDEFGTQLEVGFFGEKLLYRFTHDFIIKGVGDKDAIRVGVQVGALFDLLEGDGTEDGEVGEEINESALTIFGRTTAQFAVFPYVRATVSDLTARLGYGPVTLEIMVLATDEEGAHQPATQ